MNDIVDTMTRYEAGDLGEAETVVFFQQLVDSGAIYSLQGSYQREAARLIQAGRVNKRRRSK